MTTKISFFASFTSPYCYFALDRLNDLARDFQIAIDLRPVRPGIFRLADSFESRSTMEQSYFELDIFRTAHFLDLPFGTPDPYPVDTKGSSVYCAADIQTQIWRLYNLVGQVADAEEKLALYDNLMRRIWSGEPNWDSRACLEECVAAVGLDTGLVARALPEILPDVASDLDSNETAFAQAGHWGVPTFAFDGEPFYGQDRLDQLRWRVAIKTADAASVALKEK